MNTYLHSYTQTHSQRLTYTPYIHIKIKVVVGYKGIKKKSLGTVFIYLFEAK